MLMKTQDLPRSSRHSRAPFPFALFRATSAPKPISRTADWHYTSGPKNRGALIVGVLAAAGLHAAMFYSVPSQPSPARAIAAPRPDAVIQIAMPPLPPEENEDQPRELVEAPSAALAVPQLADVPTSVVLSDFTQAVDLRPRADVDFGALKSMTIPVARGRGGAGLAGMGTIFNLSQLDRVPQPIAQPMPNFPKDARALGIDEVVVVVEFVVDAEGRVVEPRVTSSNAPEFNSAAQLGVSRWKFRPGMLAGRKVPTRMEVPLKFDLTARR
jgi:periplasmic protein TonB